VELIIQPDAHDIVGELNVRGRPSGRAQRRRDGPKYPLLHVPIKQRTIAILARSNPGESGGGTDVKRTGETSGP